MKPAASAISIRRSHPRNGARPKEIELDASWTCSSLEQRSNASLPIFLRFLLQTTRSREVQRENANFDNFELIGESDACEGVTVLECILANSFEVFVEDDVFEGGAIVKHHRFDDFELIGEGNALEGGTSLERVLVNYFEVFVEDDTFEGDAFAERLDLDDFELIGESDTREGVAIFEYLRS